MAAPVFALLLLNAKTTVAEWLCMPLTLMQACCDLHGHCAF